MAQKNKPASNEKTCIKGNCFSGLDNTTPASVVQNDKITAFDRSMGLEVQAGRIQPLETGSSWQDLHTALEIPYANSRHSL